MENTEKAEIVSTNMEFAAAPMVTESDLENALKAAERMETLVRKIKTLVIKQTNQHDWVDMDGKPYLQSSGAEKVARLFGISWRICDGYPKKNTIADEKGSYYMYEFKGEFSMGGKTIEIVGTCSQKDKFFGKSGGELKPASEVDECSVMKKANTNMIVRGITTILGIRNMTWDEIKGGGIEQARTGKVQYKTAKDITGVVMDVKTKTGEKNGKQWTSLTIVVQQADGKQVTVQTFDAKEGVTDGVEITASGIEQKTYNGKTYFQAKTITVNEKIEF